MDQLMLCYEPFHTGHQLNLGSSESISFPIVFVSVTAMKSGLVSRPTSPGIGILAS